MVNGLLASEHRHTDDADLYGFHGLGSWVTEGHRGSQRVTEGHRGRGQYWFVVLTKFAEHRKAKYRCVASVIFVNGST
jgi:hypothetical protein